MFQLLNKSQNALQKHSTFVGQNTEQLALKSHDQISQKKFTAENQTQPGVTENNWPVEKKLKL